MEMEEVCKEGRRLGSGEGEQQKQSGEFSGLFSRTEVGLSLAVLQ